MKTNAAIVDIELLNVIYDIQHSLAYGIKYYKLSNQEYLPHYLDVIFALLDEGKVITKEPYMEDYNV